MKVLFIGTKPEPDNMEFHVIQALNEMGHQVFEFDIKTVFDINQKANRYVDFLARTLLREPERIREKKLIEYAARISPDIVIVLLGNMVSPKTVSLLKKQIKAPVVCWCQDQLSTIGRQYMIGAPYDLVFVKDHYMVELFNNMVGDRFRYLPEACNPSMHYFERPSEEDRPCYECDVTTAASLYYYRQEILKPLNDRYKVKLWGRVPDWLDYAMDSSHSGKYITDRSKRFAFSSARVVLNTLHFAEVESVNCRFFEVAGCGGFQLVSEKKEVARHLEIGREVETFRDRNELLEKIDYYLHEPEKRAEIAKNAMARAHLDHTYVHRLRDLLDQASAL